MTQLSGFRKKSISSASYKNLRQRVYNMKTAGMALTESDMYIVILCLIPFPFLKQELSNYRNVIRKSGPYESLMY